MLNMSVCLLDEKQNVQSGVFSDLQSNGRHSPWRKRLPFPDVASEADPEPCLRGLSSPSALSLGALLSSCAGRPLRLAAPSLLTPRRLLSASGRFLEVLCLTYVPSHVLF